MLDHFVIEASFGWLGVTALCAQIQSMGIGMHNFSTQPLSLELYHFSRTVKWHGQSPHSGGNEVKPSNRAESEALPLAEAWMWYFFPYPFLNLDFFFTYFYISLWKFIKIYYFFQMRMWGESNPRPIIISQTTKPLDQQGMSCQTSDFNPW